MTVEQQRDRLAVYRLLSRIPALRSSYERKFAAVASVGMLVPLATFIVYMLAAHLDAAAMWPAVLALLIACLAGFLGTSWLLRELLTPIDLTADALRQYIETRQPPALPDQFDDSAGKLMVGTQYTLSQLHETIGRLERVSASDELTGLYNRRAGENRLREEASRADRDHETFHIAFFDINHFKEINDTHGHSAGDACLAHVAQMLEATTRRGDWISRWGGDEFVVGLHRNHAVRTVVQRILHAIEVTPCVFDAGIEIAVNVSCGVAEYRFGSGPTGILSDADRAMYRAKQLSAGGRSRACYWNDASAEDLRREVLRQD